MLEVPLQSPSDFVAFLSFSPPHASLTLITATKQGKILLWTPRQNSHTYQPVALNTWAAEHVMLLRVRAEMLIDLYVTLGDNRDWRVALLSVSLAAVVFPMATKRSSIQTCCARGTSRTAFLFNGTYRDRRSGLA